VGSIEEYATASDTPEPWRVIARRVAAGEYSWQDVRDGRLCLDDDFLAAVDATADRAAASVRRPDGTAEDGYTSVLEPAVQHGGTFHCDRAAW